MQLQFSNKHIFFALESIWENLNYKFKYMINQIVTANPEDDYMQNIDVPEDILIQIFSTVTVQPEGVAAFINAEMLQALSTQIDAVSNMADVQAGTSEPNEGARIQLAINDIDLANKSVKNEKISRGKTKILA